MKFKNRPGEAARIAKSYKPLTHMPPYVQWWYVKNSYVRILLPPLVNLRACLYSQTPIFFLFQIDEMVAKRLVLRLVVTTLVITELVIQHS